MNKRDGKIYKSKISVDIVFIGCCRYVSNYEEDRQIKNWYELIQGVEKCVGWKEREKYINYLVA